MSLIPSFLKDNLKIASMVNVEATQRNHSTDRPTAMTTTTNRRKPTGKVSTLSHIKSNKKIEKERERERERIANAIVLACWLEEMFVPKEKKMKYKTGK